MREGWGGVGLLGARGRGGTKVLVFIIREGGGDGGSATKSRECRRGWVKKTGTENKD